MSEFDVIMSARSLVTYAFGLSGFILVKVLAPGFFSRQDVRTPVRIGVIALVSNLVLNLVLVWPLQHAGLALATSLAAFVNAGLLFRLLKRNGAYAPGPGWGTYLLRIALAVAVMAAVLWVLKDPQSLWSSRSLAMRGTRLAVLVIAGVATYAAACWVVGIRPRHVAQPKPAL